MKEWLKKLYAMEFISTLKAIKSKTWFIPAAVLLVGVVIVVAAMICCGGGNVNILKGLPANNDTNTPRRTVEDVVFSETRGKWKWSSSSNLVIAESESKFDYYVYVGTIRLTFELAPSKKSYRFFEYKFRVEGASGTIELTDKGPFYEKLTRLL